MIQSLRSRWIQHLQVLNPPPALAEQTFQNLIHAYSELHRHYHTLNHLASIFHCLDQHANAIQDSTRLAIATWYHDIIYDPRRNDNEERSAERAAREMHELGAAPKLISRVSQLIFATKNHAGGGADHDDNFFLDADFSILGSPESIYHQYVRNVRAEYAHVSEADWVAGRGAFLKRLAIASRIFRTDEFEYVLGEQARANIAWELQALNNP